MKFIITLPSGTITMKVEMKICFMDEFEYRLATCQYYTDNNVY